MPSVPGCVFKVGTTQLHCWKSACGWGSGMRQLGAVGCERLQKDSRWKADSLRRGSKSWSFLWQLIVTAAQQENSEQGARPWQRLEMRQGPVHQPVHQQPLRQCQLDDNSDCCRAQVPPNGLVIYTGTILTDEGKVGLVAIDISCFFNTRCWSGSPAAIRWQLGGTHYGISLVCHCPCAHQRSKPGMRQPAESLSLSLRDPPCMVAQAEHALGAFQARQHTRL